MAITQRLTRINAKTGHPTLLTWKHFLDGTTELSDVYEVQKVEIYDKDLSDPLYQAPNPVPSPIQIILPDNIVKVEDGVYQVLMDAIEHNDGNINYYDHWHYVVNSGDSVDIDVGVVFVENNRQANVNYNIDVIDDLRVYLHDDDPDMDYYFTPPDMPDVNFRMKKRNKFVWKDRQLDLALRMAESRINQTYPKTSLSRGFLISKCIFVLIRAAAVEAFRIKVPLWIQEEFEYNVGSLSLAITKAEKYQAYLDSMESNMMEWIAEFKINYKFKTKSIMSPTRVYNWGLPGGGGIGRAMPMSSSTRAYRFW